MMIYVITDKAEYKFPESLVSNFNVDENGMLILYGPAPEGLVYRIFAKDKWNSVVVDRN